MKKIRVVQVGTWRYTHAEHTMQSMRSMPDVFDVVGVCEPNDYDRELALKRSVYKDLDFLSIDEVLSDKSLDAVIIETSELEQTKTALMFAEKGFNIHMDKPGGASFEDYKKLMDIVKEKKIVFQPGYMYRYNPAVMQAIKAINEGKLGDIISTELHMSSRYTKDMLDWLGGFKGGMMFYLGCHLVDLLYIIQGKPDKVIVLNGNSGTEGTKSEDFGFALYKYKRGTSFIKTAGCETDGGARRQIVISGTKGTIQIKPIECPLEHSRITNANEVRMRLTYSPGIQSGVLRTEEYFCSPYGRYDDMLKHFAECVNGESMCLHTTEYELDVFKLFLESCGIKI